MPTDLERRPAPVHAPALAGTRARRRRGVPNPLPGVVLTLFVLFFVLPVLWLVLAATKTDDELARGHPLSFGSWQALHANWDALTAYQGNAIFGWLGNSALYSFLALVITLCVAVPAGYALATAEFRGRHTLLVATLVVMLMPNATLVVPLFLEINTVGLIGTMWSIILPYAFYPFGVYLTYIYFSTALPNVGVYAVIM